MFWFALSIPYFKTNNLVEYPSHKIFRSPSKRCNLRLRPGRILCLLSTLLLTPHAQQWCRQGPAITDRILQSAHPRDEYVKISGIPHAFHTEHCHSFLLLQMLLLPPWQHQMFDPFQMALHIWPSHERWERLKMQVWALAVPRWSTMSLSNGRQGL